MSEVNKIQILERAFERQKKARKQAEEILESKSLELYNTTQQLKIVNDKLELLLDEKDSQLKGVFENINDAYVVIDIDGNVLKMNDVAENLFGYNKNEKFNVVDTIFYEDVDYAKKSFSELFNKGKFENYTARIVTVNKEVKWVNINASIIYNKHLKPIAAQGIIRDITSQREKSLVLDVINNTAKSVLGKEDIHDISWEITKSIANYLETKDCIIYLVDDENKSLTQIAAFNNKLINPKEIKNSLEIPIGEGIVGHVAKTGISEIVNDTSKDIRYIVDDDQRFSEITVPILKDNKVIAVIDAEHKSKNYFTKEHVKTIENIASLVAMQLKSAINIAERKRVESKNLELLKKLEKSNIELQEYAHIVSHDLKSPLRSISALTSWIKSDNLKNFDSNSLQNFEDIEITLNKMDRLISDILKYSRIDATKDESKKVDLNKLLKEIILFLYVPENITINILNELPILKGDETKFQQLFQNLISNAIKFNNKEKGVINIDVENHKSFYKFSVADNGIGIEKRHFTKIFKIFQSLKKNKNSSGIGLSIVKKIVDIYKGEVWLESEKNVGTTFYFTIKK